MALRSCSSTRAAAWITDSELPWQQLVALGPSGFEAYARLRFLPDPLYDGQPEIALDHEAPSERELLHATLEVVAAHTTTPDDVYFCLWDGWGLDMYPPSVLNGPKVEVPNRHYVLLHGAVSDFGAAWDPANLAHGRAWYDLPDPAFVWPGDHAWCLANDVDPHYAGIGATSTAIEHLLDHPGLDVVRADPRSEQPHYY